MCPLSSWFCSLSYTVLNIHVYVTHWTSLCFSLYHRRSRSSHLTGQLDQQFHRSSSAITTASPSTATAATTPTAPADDPAAAAVPVRRPDPGAAAAAATTTAAAAIRPATSSASTAATTAAAGPAVEREHATPGNGREYFAATAVSHVTAHRSGPEFPAADQSPVQAQSQFLPGQVKDLAKSINQSSKVLWNYRLIDWLTVSSIDWLIDSFIYFLLFFPCSGIPLPVPNTAAMNPNNNNQQQFVFQQAPVPQFVPQQQQQPQTSLPMNMNMNTSRGNGGSSGPPPVPNFTPSQSQFFAPQQFQLPIDNSGGPPQFQQVIQRLQNAPQNGPTNTNNLQQSASRVDPARLAAPAPGFRPGQSPFSPGPPTTPKPKTEFPGRPAAALRTSGRHPAGGDGRSDRHVGDAGSHGRCGATERRHHPATRHSPVPGE